jgi:putative ABC transport system permease protein
MRDGRAARAAGRLLPAAVRREMFEPALADLVIETIGRVAAAASPLARALIRLRFAALVAVLVVECWMLVPGAIVARRREHHRVAPESPPPRKEWMPMLLYTFRHAARLLARERGFTFAAVATLALGVGANVAIFAIVEPVMLRPLPYADADRLAIVRHRDLRTGITKEFIAIGDFVDLASRQTAFESLASYGGFSATISGHGDPFQASGLLAGPGLFEALRVRPALGRALTADDSRPNAPVVALLGHEIWRTRFGSDPAVVGRSITIGTKSVQIVGVAPEGFRFPAGERTDLVAAATLPVSAPAERKSNWTFAVARLRPGASLATASTNLAAVSSQLEREFPASNTGSQYYAVSLRDELVGDTKRPLELLAASVAVVLFIACANVGNLLLARGLGRRHEMSVRIALGAGRGRLVGQLVAESLTLTLAAGTAGVVLAHWGVPALVSLVPRSVTVPGLTDVGINRGVLFFALGIVLFTALAFSAISVLMLRRETGARALVSQQRVGTSAAARRATSALVVAEIALAVVLLVGAGLILRSFARLLSVDPGFHLDRVAVLEMSLPAGRYRQVGARQSFYQRAFATLEAGGQVARAGAAAVVPLTGNNWTVPFERADRPVPAGQRPPDVGWQAASRGYFEALQIPLVAGRLFDDRDTPATAPVVIISQAVATRFFDTGSPVGRRVKLGDGDAEIVGVVGDIRRAGLTDEPRADMYFPFERSPTGSTTLFVRTAGEPLQALPAVQSALRAIEPALVFGEVRTLAAVAGESVAVTRLALWLLGVFAAIALALAAIGIYAVMSYAVGQRTREIGTRVALGATRGAIARMVMRQGAVMTAAGLAIGLGAGLILARSLAVILYGVSASDPATLGGALAILAAATMAACYLPARRASRVDAARTLAGE